MTKFPNRHLYIGGSDFGTVLDVCPYKKRIELVLEKAQVLANTFEGNFATERGTRLEDEVIRLFEEETGLTVKDKQKEFKREKTDNIMTLLCHVDGITSNDAVFEAKTTDINSKTWKDGIPEYYKAQLEFNMFLSGLKGSYITVAYCDGNKIVKHQTYTYTRQMTDHQILFNCQVFTADVEKFKKLGIINSGVIRNEDIDSNMVDRYNYIKEELSRLKLVSDPLEKEKKIIEEKLKKQISNDAGIENELFRITLGNRITAPKNDYNICRSTLKIEYK